MDRGSPRPAILVAGRLLLSGEGGILWDMETSFVGVELHDDPIVLRAWREDDAAAVYAMCQDPEIQRWLPDMPRLHSR